MAPMSTRSGRLVAFDGDMVPKVATAPEVKREESWQQVDFDSRTPSGDEMDGQLDSDEMDFSTSFAPDTLHEDILHPLREAANRVGKEVERFAEVLDHYNPLKATSDVERKEMAFDLIEEYQDIALSAVQRIRNEQRVRGGYGRSKERLQSADAMDDEDSDESGARVSMKTTPEDLDRWEKEARTWDLLHRMVTLQHNPPAPKPIKHIHRYSPESEIWDAFLCNDILGLERCTVLQWLKETANESGEDINDLVQDLQQNAERGDITAHGWLHTKEAIKKQKRLHAWPYILDHTSPDVQRIHLSQTNREPLISQLDPDAPMRQGRKLEAPDEYFERSIWQGCYELLRRGKSGKEIQEWCQERQELWRAVSMAGLPDASGDDSIDIKSKALWRRMCFALAKRDVTDAYESAVYGILSGDYHSVPAVCKSWDDYLFAHFNALVRSQYENYVIKNFPDRIPRDVLQLEVFDASSFYGEPKTVAARTVEMINRIDGLEEEIQQPIKFLQGVIIAQQFHNFITEQGVSLAAAGGDDETGLTHRRDPEGTQTPVPYIKNDDIDGLRLLTHMILAFKSCGMEYGSPEDTEAIENVIVCYIQLLRLSGKEELIPLYAAQLSETRCYETLSRVLLDVTDRDMRQNMIKLLQQLGLNVQQFVRMQFRSVLEDYPENGSFPAKSFKIVTEAADSITYLSSEVPPDFMATDIERPEELMISAFEWFLEVDGMWKETFEMGAKLYRRLFRQGKLAAARLLAQRMPADELCQLKSPPFLRKSVRVAELMAEDQGLYAEDDVDAAYEIKLRKVMAESVKPYLDLENLINAIGYIEDIAGGIHELEEAQAINDTAASTSLRRQFVANFTSCRQFIELLFSDFLPPSLLSSYTDLAKDLAAIKSVYLPAVVAAYQWLLDKGGMYISRELLLDSADFLTRVASDAELLRVLTDAPLGGESVNGEKPKMKQLVNRAATNALVTLYSTRPGKREAALGRSAKERGAGFGVWRAEGRA